MLRLAMIPNESSSTERLRRNVVAKTRKTEKAIEIHEFYVIRSASGSLPALCGECTTGDAIMVAAEQAAVIARVPVRMIYRWVEAAVIHYKEGPNGSLLVCLKSLPTTADPVTLSQLRSADE
jgi:hypothetical protein